MNRIKIAIAGCGDIAHIRYFYSLGKMQDMFELVAVHDKEPSICETTAKEFNVPNYDDLDEMLTLSELDTLVITTYHPSHAPIAIKAMRAGKNVLIEKPFATSSKDAKLVKAVSETTGKLCMPLPYATYPNIVAARKFINDGTIGQICSCDGIFSHQGPLHAPWFFDKKEADWGVLADLGVYPLSILTYLLGPFRSVTGKVEIMIPNRTSLKGDKFISTVEDNVVAALEWENGVLGTIRSNWCTAADKSGCIYSITIYGTKGIIYLNMHTRELVVYSPYKPIENAKKINYLGFEQSYLISLNDYDDHMEILKSYYNAYVTGAFECDEHMIDRQVNVIEAIEKLYESSAKGKVMEI
jgi:predicted dehydrogenase